VVSTRGIGPALAFERVWEETGCRDVIERLASARKHDFSPERVAFLTVLHRLFCGGSDRAADLWREDYRIEGVEGLELHHLNRAHRAFSGTPVFRRAMGMARRGTARRPAGRSAADCVALRKGRLEENLFGTVGATL